ncbi:MAG TPA: family 1 encapsulin nanocompartment shell protein [bacterium]|nr:family 1 encapsulin nanocompartment shell protein [bacterium]
MDILKKSLAPVTEKTWEELHTQANRILKSRLTARKFVDVDGPKGWDYGALPLGRLDIPDGADKGDVRYGINTVQPLVETRVPFILNIWELDNITRGAQDADLGPMEDAARNIAGFEEQAVYYGFENGGITGLKEATGYKKVSCPKKAEEVLRCVPQGISEFKEASIDGPYLLVVNPTDWREITSYIKGYPLKRQVEQNLEAEIVFCPNIDNMFLVTNRGGDYQLTLGADLSIGYERHDSENVHLYFTESFTFRVLEPNAVFVFEE